LNIDDIARPKRGGKRDYEAEGTVFDHDSLVDVEATIDERQFFEEYHGIKVEPNPPPETVGEIGAKTICRRVVSEMFDCGSCKTFMVMLFYIDSANHGTSNCWPAEETTAAKLRFSNTKAVSRANRWWRSRGCNVDGERIPFLTLARKGRRRPDGTKQSNAYHVQWMALLTFAAQYHWCANVRAAAKAYCDAHTVLKRLKASGQICPKPQDKSVQNHRTNLST
jgi:hypothetical protein